MTNWPAYASAGNPPSHNGTAILHALRVASTKLFSLLPYSPDLNPIEQMFAKLKTLLRKVAERTVETTWKRIGTPLGDFTATECANYTRESGHVAT